MDELGRGEAALLLVDQVASPQSLFGKLLDQDDGLHHTARNICYLLHLLHTMMSMIVMRRLRRSGLSVRMMTLLAISLVPELFRTSPPSGGSAPTFVARLFQHPCGPIASHEDFVEFPNSLLTCLCLDFCALRPPVSQR